MALGNVFRVARTLGDTSSLFGGGVSGVAARAQSRVVGRGTSSLMKMDVWGLVMWAEFFGWLNTAVQVGASKDVFVGTALPYAAGYEFGFQNPSGRRTRRPYFFPAVTQVTAETRFGRGGGSFLSLSGLGPSRSGVYVGGRFFADIRSIANGSVGQRLARRQAGGEISRFFWGTLADPTRNVNEAIANRIIALSRRAARADDLVDTSALVMSIVQGNSFEEWRQKSLSEGLKRSRAAGRLTGNKFTGTRGGPSLP